MPRAVFILLMLFSLHMQAQPNELLSTNELFTYLYNQNKVKFDSTFQASEANPYINLVSAYNFYWQGLNDSIIFPSFNKALALIKQSLLNEQQADIIVTFYLLQMRMDVTQKKYLSLWLNTNKIKDYFYNNPLNMSDSYSQLLWGLYNYFVAYLRESSVVYATFLVAWPDAEKDKGLSILKRLATSNSLFIATEAQYFLGKIYLEFENNVDLASRYFLSLKKQFPGNKIYNELWEGCEKAAAS